MTILHYLVTAAALLAAAGMLAVSYIAIVMVKERKQREQLADTVLRDIRIVSGSHKVFMPFIEGMAEGKIEALIKMDFHKELSSNGEALKKLEEIVTEKMKEWWEKEMQRLERELLYGNSNIVRPEGLIRCPNTRWRGGQA